MHDSSHVKHLFTESSEFSVGSITWHAGRRSKEVIKHVIDPFIKMVGKEMSASGGKWNGNGAYVFKDKQKADSAQLKMDAFREKWRDILKDFPEERQDIQTSVAVDYFRRIEKEK